MLQTDQEFIAQEWPFEPGERKVKMHVEAPDAGINDNTGLMLVLHNWAGRYNEAHYVQWCKAFADRYNVVAASVNYLQSGGGEPTIAGEKPYDHGYLQAVDCLRALYHIQRQITDAAITFNPRRCYAMGGSGGGNVALMANKLAPHTFACVVDICGMPGLTDGIAYGTGEYGSKLNAGYSTWNFSTPELDFSVNVTLYPSITDSGRFRSDTDIRLSWEIVEDLFVGFSGWASTDNKAESDKKVDYGITTELGWEY